jgi:hypothetical protein
MRNTVAYNLHIDIIFLSLFWSSEVNIFLGCSRIEVVSSSCKLGNPWHNHKSSGWFIKSCHSLLLLRTLPELCLWFLFFFHDINLITLQLVYPYQISGRDKFLKVIEFLRRQLHQDTLVGTALLVIYEFSPWHTGILLTIICVCQQFVYINSAFSPNPDELVIDLYNVSFLQCLLKIDIYACVLF